MWKNEKVEGVEQTYRGQCDLCKNHSDELVEWNYNSLTHVCDSCESELEAKLEFSISYDAWSRE